MKKKEKREWTTSSAGSCGLKVGKIQQNFGFSSDMTTIYHNFCGETAE